MRSREDRSVWAARFCAAVAAFVLAGAALAQTTAPAWQLSGWRFRAPVLVVNAAAEAKANVECVLPDFLFATLAEDEKLRPDGADLRVVDEAGKGVPVRAEKTPAGAWRVAFALDQVPAKDRRVLWLYYGNAQAKAEGAAAAGTASSEVRFAVGAEESAAAPPKVRPDALAAYLKAHPKAESEFSDARVWVRWMIPAPGDFQYTVRIDCDLNPYSVVNKHLGIVGRYGLIDEACEKALGGDLPRLAGGDLLSAGQYSAWVQLPTSQAAQWNTVIRFVPKTGVAVPAGLTAQLEFALRPSESFIFHISQEPVDVSPGTGPPKQALVAVRMPTETKLAATKQLETFTEWARRRRGIVEELRLGPPPRVTRIRIGTWAYPGSSASRVGGGFLTQANAENDFAVFEAIGINMLSIGGVSDEVFAAMAREHGIIDTTYTVWADAWRYTGEAYGKQYDYQGAETPPQRWQRVFDDYYRKAAENGKKASPFAFGLATHINLGDEIGPATTAEEIRKTPPLLALFHEWLTAQKLSPELLGAKTMPEVLPVDDRAQLKAADCPVETARLFYFTRRFIDDYTASYYRIATAAVAKYFPHPRMIAVNYQAGAFQCGFLGNDNDPDRGEEDIFQYARLGAFRGVMMEDWVGGTDFGVGHVCLGADILRAAARKGDLPLASYLVGGGGLDRRFYAYLMGGVKEIGLYLYGPVSTIGPAWGDDKNALAAVAKVSRDVKGYEDILAGGSVRRAKAAMLIAATSDIMQVKGLYCFPQRQHLYIALKHAYVPVDIVCEQDILEDDLLKEYSLLYLADPQVRRDVQMKIADWVKAGGRLWACLGAANWDEYNQPCDALDAVFGARKRQMTAQDNWLPASTGIWATAVSRFAYKQLGTLKADAPIFGGVVELPVWGAKLACEPTTAQVLGKYEDGSPAVLSNKFGKGQALLVGALVGEAYMRTHYAARPDKEGWTLESGAPARQLVAGLVGAAAVSRPVELSVPGFYTAVMDAPAATVVFVNGLAPQGKEPLKFTARIDPGGKVSAVESARQGKLRHQVQDGRVVVDLSCPPGEAYVDMILLRR